MSNELPAAAELDDANRCDITFFVACYNEEANIVACLDNLTSAVNEVGLTYDIVVVDDASVDNSVNLVRRYMADHPDVPLKLIVNASNQGFGSNYAEAAFHGNGKYYRAICGDDEERRETIVEVLRHTGKADLILTYHSDASARPWSRRFISWFYTGMVNLLSGHRVRYYNGLPLTRRYDVMRWHSYAHGFGFQADLVARLLDQGATFLELPVVPTQRQQGHSKAFTIRNFCSVGHTFIEIFIRHVAHTMYPKYRAQIAHKPQAYMNDAFRQEASKTTAE